MTLLVTGGAGFIGANFIHYWLDNHPDDRIINYDKLTYAGNLENLDAVKDHPNYQFVHGDINNQELLTHVFRREGVDTVVHFAAETHVDRSLHESAKFLQTNVAGTQALLEVALQFDVTRFHHVSTDEVFGAIGEHEDWAFSEETPYAPRNPYSASKAGSDHLVRAYHESFGLPITITNCSNNYGPYQFPEKFISLAITNLLEDKPIPVYGEGRQSRDWLYVIDHCRAIDRVLADGNVGETYCVGGMNTEITNLEVAQTICRLMNKDPKTSLVFVEDRPGHDFKYVVDWSKIQDELGWQPKAGFSEWLQNTIQWYIDNRAWWQRIKSGDYQMYYARQYGGQV
jgi:dTDP-glucose 4,6-dehydratase